MQRKPNIREGLSHPLHRRVQGKNDVRRGRSAGRPSGHLQDLQRDRPGVRRGERFETWTRHPGLRFRFLRFGYAN